MAASPTPEAVLSSRLRQRDHAAWEELYAAYGPRLRAFALRLTRDPHEADDLVQETFVRALPRLDRMNADEVDLKAYLFTTLRNTFLKSCERKRRVAPVEEVPEPATPAAIEDDPERSLLLRRQIEEVRVATAGLSPRQRLALSLRDLEDCSYAEIGLIVGIKENAVAQLISRARESLRSALRLAQVDFEGLPDGCRRLLPQLSRYLDGQLRGEALERTLAHLATCGGCRDALESMREASRRYRSLVPPLILADEAHAAAIDAELTAAGYWRRRRSPRLSRRVALAGAAALLLGGGGALVLASGPEPAGRVVTAGSRAIAATASPAAAQPRRSAAPETRARAEGGGDRERSVTSRPPTVRRRTATGDAAPTPERDRRARIPERKRSNPRPAPAATVGPRDLRPAAGGETPAATRPPDPTPAADTTAPAVEITSASTTGDQATFEFIASESGATLACGLDGGALKPCASRQSYTGVASGPHTFAVSATDAAGNTGAAATHAWSVSEPLPDLVVTSLTTTGFTVANAGTAPAASFVVTVTTVGTFTFAGLAPGATATQSWTCRRGTLDLIADRQNTVAESDERNNRRSLDSSC